MRWLLFQAQSLRFIWVRVDLAPETRLRQIVESASICYDVSEVRPTSEEEASSVACKIPSEQGWLFESLV